MLKVILPAGFGFDTPIACLADIHSRGPDSSWMTKRAAVLTKELSEVRPERGHSFIHVISLGAMESVGQNRNGDAFNWQSRRFTFPEPKKGGHRSVMLDGGLTQYHNTFVKYAHVFKHHCFVDGTPVVMGDHTRRPIETVRCGEYVATRAGPQRVVRTMRRNYRGIGVSLSLFGHPEPVIATKGHPFFVFRRGQIHCRHGYNRLAGNENHAYHCREYRRRIGKLTEAPAVSLREGDYLVFPRPKLGNKSVEPAFARLIGWVAAEGYLGKNYAIQFTFAESNVEDIAAVLDQFNALGVRCSSYVRGDGLVTLSASNKALHARLSRYVQGTFAEKRLMPAVFELNEQSVRHLLSTYIDGDGCVTLTGRNRGDLRIRSSSPLMLLCLSDLLRAVGIPTRVNSDRSAGDMLSPTNGLVYRGNPSGVVQVGRTFAGEAATGRKTATVTVPVCRQTRDLLDDLYLVKIAKVQFVELDCPVNNLEVEGEHHYIGGEVLVHNCNREPADASGKIVAAALNPEMLRGELLIKVQDDKWAPELEKLARDEDLAVSMSCKVPYDYCTLCGNKAANRREYCDHLKYEMNHVKEGGYQVGAINDAPTFFDLSAVHRPADRIAYAFRKVAENLTAPGKSSTIPGSFDGVSSAELAELFGVRAPYEVLLDGSPRIVQEKLAAMKRLAAMEKQIEATGRLFGKADSGRPAGSVPPEVIKKLRSCDLGSLMGALSDAKICLPVEDFHRYVLGDKYDSVAGEMDSVKSLLPGIMSRMLESGDGVEDATGTKTYDPGTSLVPKAVRDLIESLVPSMSVAEGPVRRRIRVLIIRGESPGGERKLRKTAAAGGAGETARYLAGQYAAYQLAFARAQGGAGDGLTEGMIVLMNHAA